MPELPWCDTCGLPAGHGQCLACLALRYPSDRPADSQVDWCRMVADEGIDTSKMPDGLRRAAQDLADSIRERVEEEDEDKQRGWGD